MKQFNSLLFAVIILFTPVYNAAVWLDYDLNKERITELFCINKAEPESKCLGSCHVKKNLIKQETKTTSSQASSETISLNRVNLYLETLAEIRLVNDKCNNLAPVTCLLYSDKHIEEIFRPPIV
jgi:hypothetical protein